MTVQNNPVICESIDIRRRDLVGTVKTYVVPALRNDVTRRQFKYDIDKLNKFRCRFLIQLTNSLTISSATIITICGFFFDIPNVPLSSSPSLIDTFSVKAVIAVVNKKYIKYITKIRHVRKSLHIPTMSETEISYTVSFFTV